MLTRQIQAELLVQECSNPIYRTINFIIENINFIIDKLGFIAPKPPSSFVVTN